jgi:predicted nucleic acid-binding protein
MFYLDTSFVAPLLVPEPASNVVDRFVAKLPPGSLAVSHWTRLEFSSLLGRRVRMRLLSRVEFKRVWEKFDSLLAEVFEVILPEADDYNRAEVFLAAPRAGLRAGDALHLAIAANHSAERLYTLDKGLLKAARALRVPASFGIQI